MVIMKRDLFKPFDKDFSEIMVGDLEALKAVKEGWYVDYKAELPKVTDIAKHIGAFANTYGGWLFIGIQEKGKEDPVAGTFLGVDRSAVDSCVQAVRQAASSNLMPVPHFEIKVLWGPCPEIELYSGRAIICIWTPSSVTTPHIHKDGRIYRRVHDSSEPKAENDRFAVDQLLRRGKGIRRRYAKWIRKSPEFTVSRISGPYLRLLIEADIWKDRNLWTELAHERLRALLQLGDVPPATIPFETVYPLPNGLIARQLNKQDPQYLGIIWKFRRDLRSEVLLPLNVYELDEDNDDWTPGIRRTAESTLNGYNCATRYANILAIQRFREVKIVDLNSLYINLCALLNTQRRLAEAVNWNGPTYCKVQLLNIAGVSPFIDIESLVDEFDTHGLPVSFVNNSTMPDGVDPDSFIEFEDIPTMNRNDNVSLHAFMLFSQVAQIFGVPNLLQLEGENAIYKMISELIAAGVRSHAFATRIDTLGDED